jgi:hypothetical protein
LVGAHSYHPPTGVALELWEVPVPGAALQRTVQQILAGAPDALCVRPPQLAHGDLHALRLPFPDLFSSRQHIDALQRRQ